MPLPESYAARAQAFFELLQSIHKGDAFVEYLDFMEQAVKAVRDRHRPATLVLKLNITPGGAEDDVLYLSASSQVKLPAPKRAESTYFAWNDGTIKRQRELQATMFDDEKPRLVTGTVIPRGERIPEVINVGSDDDFTDDRSLAQ